MIPSRPKNCKEKPPGAGGEIVDKSTKVRYIYLAVHVRIGRNGGWHSLMKGGDANGTEDLALHCGAAIGLVADGSFRPKSVLTAGRAPDG